MHSYIRAIGFTKIKTKSQFQSLLESVVASPDSVTIVPYDGEYSYAVMMKAVDEGIGLALCGEVDPQGHFDMEYHFPYFWSRAISTFAECDIKKQIEKEAYNGVCDDPRLGLNLIFYVNNFIEHKKREELTGKWPRTGAVCLSGLCISGKILLPIQKTEKQVEHMKSVNNKCMHLMAAAKKGDQAAIEDLAVYDMNLNAEISKRVKTQDIYSIVETSFMPYGIEPDQYSILGYIVGFRMTSNDITQEKMYLINVLCNDILIRICISVDDLLGEPKVGYRFKGNIWLQGKCVIA